MVILNIFKLRTFNKKTRLRLLKLVHPVEYFFWVLLKVVIKKNSAVLLFQLYLVTDMKYFKFFKLCGQINIHLLKNFEFDKFRKNLEF